MFDEENYKELSEYVYGTMRSPGRSFCWAVRPIRHEGGKSHRSASIPSKPSGYCVYTTTAKIEDKLTSPGRLCGTHDKPNGTRRLERRSL